jgi:hypothetical protein
MHDGCPLLVLRVLLDLFHAASPVRRAYFADRFAYALKIIIYFDDGNCSEKVQELDASRRGFSERCHSPYILWVATPRFATVAATNTSV